MIKTFHTMITWKSNTPATYGNWSADIEIEISSVQEGLVFYIKILDPKRKSECIGISSLRIFDSKYEDSPVELLKSILEGRFDSTIENLLVKKISEILVYINQNALGISNDKSDNKCFSKEIIVRDIATVKHITNFILFLKEKSLSQLQ